MTRVGRGVRRARLGVEADTSWWDALDMQDGTRRVVRLGPAAPDGLVWTPDAEEPGVAWSAPVAYSLADLLPLPGEPPLAGDVELHAAVAAAGLRAALEGRLGAGLALEERLVRLGGRWVVVGREPGTGGEARLAALLLRLDADDPLGLAGVLADGAPVDRARWLVGAMAAHLAHERHVLARRADADRKGDALAALRALAARLAAAFGPPAYVAGDVRSAGGRLTVGDVGVWDGERLDAPAARALCRRLLGVPDAAPLRRWVVASSRLRVDRAILARR